MPDPRYPGAVRDPGFNAGYANGRTSMQWCVCHYTVGVDSSAIGRRGYFNYLVSRDGTVTQYAETDSLTFNCGEGNPYGPGIEIEYLPGQDDVVFTDAAREACSALIKWLNTEWGIPLVYHDASHDTLPGSYTGFLSHRSIIQSEGHSDYWPQSDWDLMVAPAPVPPAPRKDLDMNWIVQSERVKGTPATYWCRGDVYSWCKDEGIIGYLKATIPPEQLHVNAPGELVGEDWLGMFTLVGDDYKPGK